MIFAHYGGIDEVGIFVVPVLLAIFALRWADKRARMRSGAEDEERPAAGEEGVDKRE
jgi:hypothetical protein